MPTVSLDALPRPHIASREFGEVLEQAVDAMPEIYRVAFMLRDVEGLSISETAACLAVTEQTAKRRIHSARVLLRNHLSARSRTALPATFQFAQAQHDALVTAVLARIARPGHDDGEERRDDSQTPPDGSRV